MSRAGQSQFRDFTLIKFEEQNVVLMHNRTKKLYRFLNTPHTKSWQHTSVQHYVIQTPIKIQTGILFPKQTTTLKQQLTRRRGLKNLELYEQEQLVNTFMPLLQCIRFLHSKELAHNGIAAQAVVINQNNDIKLRNYVHIQNNPYYPQKLPTLSNDMRALGFLLLQSVTLKPIKQLVTVVQGESVQTVLKQIKNIQRYSKGFIYGLICLINRMSRYLPRITSIITNSIEQKEISPDLKDSYNRITKSKDKGVSKIRIQTKNVFQHIRNLNNEIQTLNIKKSSKIQPKKLIKVDNAENTTFNEEIKKKHLQKINRIIEKSKVFASELALNRKNSDQGLRRITHFKVNNSDLKNPCWKIHKYKQDVITFSSQLKRLRSGEKHKIDS